MVFAVSDTGIGMNNKTLEKIFEPFFTTKQPGKGTGLGLATVYGIVRQNGGLIRVISQPGEGATFKVFWPATTEIPDDVTRAPLPETALRVGSERVLLVEDDEAVRDFTRMALDDLGYTVYEACNGKEALDFLEHDQIGLDLLITDLIMPEMNGKELAERVAERYPNLPILFTSGYIDDHIVRMGALEKGIQFIKKPFSIQALAQKVREVIDQARG